MNKRLTPILIITSAFWLFGLSAKAQDRSTGPTIGGSVYGGGKGSSATVTGAVSVDFQAGTVGTIEAGNLKPETGDVYGGGKQAVVEGATTVELKGGTVRGDLYGGGALANVTSNAIVTLTGGSTRMVFGGGKGDANGSSAQVNGTTTVNVNNGSTVDGKVIATVGTTSVKGAVFGGCNEKGSVGSSVAVNANGGSIGGNVYGGGLGDLTTTDAGVTVTIEGATITGDVYGGSALGKVNNAVTDLTKVELKSGSLTNLYGGGMGQTGASADKGKVNGKVEVLVKGGTVANVFGCNNYNGAPQGDVTVTVEKVNNATWSVGNVYGGGNQASYSGPTPTNERPNNPVVLVKNGAITNNVYGGGLGSTAKVLSNPKVTFGDATTGYSVSAVNVYGGGSAAEVGNSATTPKVIKNAEVLVQTNASAAKVFGGGMAAGVTGTTTLTISDGSVTAGVYGGCDNSGEVGGNITVNVNGGTIGTDTDHRADIFGGGYGENTSTSGNVTVSFGAISNTHSVSPMLYGDVYGGSALGSVNTPNGNNTTIVNINNGTLVAKTETEDGFPAYRGGNVFGGGLGLANVMNGNTIVTDNSDKGQVNGAVTVNIGSGTLADSDPDISEVSNIHGKASIGGNVYGCNNTNGSPQKDVLVNVFQTHHTANDSATYIIPSNQPAANALTYAIHNVFGGGNKADYTGTVSTGTPVSVKIYTCDNTVQRVFGGGNAAATNSITTMIQGGRFAEVYCGGNGEVSPANVNGTAALNIHGGNIGETFGGSNQQGTISQGATVNVDDDGPCDAVVVEEFFCGGKYANYVGNIEATITCNQGMHVRNLYGGCKEAHVVPGNGQPGNVHLSVYGGTFENVYGGSKGTATTPANIAGDVTLDIFGGTIDTIFGGSNINGNVFGKITVNVLDLGGSCALTAHNVYGGGRNAAYTPTSTTPGAYPEVNIFHGAISLKPELDAQGDTIKDSNGNPVYIGGGKVFGGGYGAGAVIKSNPKVTIGYVDGMTLPSITGSYPSTYTATVDSIVFGGGDLAAVAGSTSVTIQKDDSSNSSALSLFGGGNKASVGEATVNVLGGSVTAGVYGGCNESGTVGGGNINYYAYTYNSNTNTWSLVETPEPVYGNIDVNIKSDLGTANNALAEGIYGGGKGNLTQTTGAVTVTIGDNSTTTPSAPTIYSDVYGGSAFGQVGASDKLAKVDLKAGTINGTIYGGGKGSDTYSATVSGNTELAINGSVTGGVYGGCNVNGTVAGGATVGINGGTIGVANNTAGIVFGGGLGENTVVSGPVALTIGTTGTGPTINGDVYGGSAKGKVNCTLNNNQYVHTGSGAVTGVTMNVGTITGNLYGGGLGEAGNPGIPADVYGPVTVNVEGGSVNDVFGCNNIKGAPKSTVQVNINNNVAGNVFGGGNEADYTGTPDVNITNGTVSGSVFGGGNKAGVGGGDVAMTGGTVTTGVYGGCNEQGEVAGDIIVNITDGTVGASNARANVHGGGLGNPTSTSGNVTVTFGAQNASHTEYPKLFGDIYGGSGYGNVNNSNSTTTVNVLNGEITGDVYGGGLGDRAVANDNTHHDYPALVYGDVVVNIGNETTNNVRFGQVKFNRYDNNTKGGQIFGCNNTNGTPKKDVAVNIYSTAHGTTPATNAYPSSLPEGYTSWTAAALAANTTTQGQTYAIAAVYGGGNLAAYTPDALTAPNRHKAEVNVYGCDNTIKDVYGGGNAANVGVEGETGAKANTNITIDGGRINHVFGGGNGEGTELGANIYGTASTTVNGGLIDQIFGGGNKKGTITSTILNLANTDSCDDEVFGEVFGGANESPIAGAVNTTVNCGVGDIGYMYGGSNLADIGTSQNPNASVTLNILGGSYDYVFGGSKGEADHAADIYGTTTLNLYGGTINNAFGGSNIKGNITGKITINMLDKETNSCGLTVHNIYGASNLAAYTPTNPDLVSPEVNLFHGSVTKSGTNTTDGNVYGGAKGSTATVTANPKVNVGYVTTMTLPGDVTSISKAQVAVAGNVYGGGDEAAVSGGTTIMVQRKEVSDNYTTAVSGNIFGGGNLADVSGSTSVEVTGGTVTEDAYGGGALANVGSSSVALGGGTVRTLYGGGMGNTTTAALVNGDAQVTVNSGTINGTVIDNTTGLKGGVFGGCNVKGAVLGNTELYVNGAVGTGTNRVNVYGGGLGQNTNVVGAVAVTVGQTGTPTIYGDVYGGSAKGLVNYSNETTPAANGNTTTVTLSNGTVTGDIYGGGHGLDNQLANVGGPVTVAINGGSVSAYGTNNANGGNVFGCNNLKGAPQNTVTVNVSSNVATNVYGGGNEAAYTNSGNYPAVNILKGTVSGSVFGGGKGSGATVSGRPTVIVGDADHAYSATVGTNVYGGGDLAAVNGSTSVTVQKNASGSTTVTHNVYGGGNQANVSGSSEVVMTGGTVNEDVYGGGALANVNTNTTVAISGGSTRMVFGGGMGNSGTAAQVVGTAGVTISGNATVSGYNIGTQTSPIMAAVFGGCNVKGSVGGAITLNANGGNINGNVYGGGLGENTTTGAAVTVTVNGSSIANDVYGGSALGQVNTNTDNLTKVNLKSGSIAGKLYGGGMGQTGEGNVAKGRVNGRVEVLVEGGSVTDVFGCNNFNGTPLGTVKVDVNKTASTMTVSNVYGGGNQAAYSYNTGNYPEVNITNGTVGTNVYGGGLGATAVVTGNPKVTVNGGTVTGNVFGGGSEAVVSGATHVIVSSGAAGYVYGGGALASTGATTVDILGGTINYDIFGGGLGDDEHTPAEDGIVTVNIGAPPATQGGDPIGTATILGNVFGCNNAKGSPTNYVFVNVYRTAHNDNNQYPTINTLEEFGNLPNTDDQFALKAVYGGGNRAAYNPTANASVASVHVFYCNENTVKTVYGGGNAADATNVQVVIDGGRFYHVFGGGNGAGNDNPGANISGTATTRIHGGLIFGLFGGSDSKGDVGAVDLTIDNESGCQEMLFESFGGANQAPITGEVVTNLECSNIEIGNFYGGSNLANIYGNVTLNVYGGKYINVFGGSKGIQGGTAADIKVYPSGHSLEGTGGNVTLNLYGGEITNAFGGSDANGNIEGKILVNVVDDKSTNTSGNETCPLVLHNVYGGGRNAAYSPITSMALSSNYSPEVNVVSGTVSTRTSGNTETDGNVFGGGLGSPAIVKSNPKVTIGYVSGMSLPTGYSLPSGYQAVVEGSVYGGGSAAMVGNTSPSSINNTEVLVQNSNSTVAKVFGGGMAAGVTGTTKVTIADGTVTHGVYGGCDSEGAVTGNITVDLAGGTVGINTNSDADVVFGGGLGHPTSASGSISVNLNGTNVYGNLYGGSALGSVNSATVTLSAATLHGKVFGGGMGEGTDADHQAINLGVATVNVNEANANGNLSGIYGGANVNGNMASSINVNVKANVGASSSRCDIFGGGLGANTTTDGAVTVTVDQTANPTIYGDVYGGSAFGQVGASGSLTKVDFQKGALHGTIYGGGKGQATTPEYAAVVNGNVQVDVADGNVYGGVYGGCNAKGNVAGNITLNITKGEIGVNDNNTKDGIYGGGYGGATTSGGAVTVNIAANNATEGPTIYGDLYGGSGFGQVSATDKLTQVNFYKGTINGDIYGGGLGSNEHSAEVSGNVEVNIRGGVFNSATGTAGGGQVFGCNNAKGTPKGNVAVNIYGTDHGTTPATNAYPSGITTAALLAQNATTQAYAIAAVYGGGNLASYEPVADKSTTVHVYNCDNTIKDVFGGGNAANVGTQSVNANTYITIDGGRINRVFGGGNGQTAAANINGLATTTINAGLIDQIFGGGNVNGTISNTSLNLAKSGSCTDEVFGEVFGGANEAPIAGTLSTTINCGVGTIGTIYGGSNLAQIGTAGSTNATVNLTINGGTYDYVFGGSKGAPGESNGANINGNVNLYLYGGTIANAFGGSNINGNITGQIKVDVLDQGDCDLALTNVYGGGKDASYQPNTATLASPEVNIKHIKQNHSITNVYGGGYGSSAEVKAYPKVTIGDTESTHYATISNNVYGGGEQAPVTGSPTVIIQNANSTVKNIFGGGNLANVSAGTIVNINGGTVSEDVYGGGALASTGGSTVTLAGGTVTHDIYGGGLGRNAGSGLSAIAAEVTGPVHVTVNSGSVRDVYGCNNENGSPTGTVQVDIKGPVTNNVYGGGNLATSGITPVVNIMTGANVTGSVFGGGNNASVAGGDVNMQAGTILGGLYGGCNTNGSSGNITVDVTGGTIGASGTPANVHGGGYGNGTSTTGDVEVTINGSSAAIWGDVYGGSAKGHVNDAAADHTNVTLTRGTIHGDLYGGGLGDADNAATVNGAVQVTVNGGTVTGSVYGCNNANGAPQSTVKVDIYGTDTPASGYALANVFGGGNQAAYGGSPEVTIHNCDNSIGNVYGGGNKASVVNTNVKVYGGNTIGYVFGGGNGEGVAANYTMVSGNAEANIYGGTIGHVFGGNNSSGAITGTVAVNVDKQTESGHNSCDMYIAEVYGGGNEAAGNAGTITIGCTGTWTNNHNSHNNTNNRIGYELEGIGTVYGGANKANVNNGIDLNIVNGIVENVFGGNNTSGSVNDTIRVTINKGSGCDWYVGNVYGGGNLAQYGAPNGKPDYPKVRILNGTVSGDVFGGGLGQTGDAGKVTGNTQVTVNGANAAVNGSVYGGGSLAPTQGNPVVTLTNGALTKVFGGGKAADVTGAPTVGITGGTVSTGVYGGCDSQGNVSGDITVNVTGGTIGSQASLNNNTTADIYGGGYGENTTTSGNVTVTFGTAPAPSATPTLNESLKIYGDIYGGSALGQVNASSGNNTIVNVLDGQLISKEIPHTTPVNYIEYLGGNVFGGGLGETGNTTKGQVNGKVFVNIGAASRALDPTNDSTTFGNAAIGGNVYGCNNTSGSPQDDVTVNIYRTYRKNTDQINHTPDSEWTYAIANVFGGGNRANYTASNKTANVNIFSCYNSIQRLFGGGNAAEAPNVHTTIQGGRFEEVFGGGNGEVSAANITGNVNLEIHGGTIGSFFAGSNQNGSITGTSNVTIDQVTGCEDVNITEFYCGGKYADFIGDINATITCAQNMHVNNLYGGCKEAHVRHKGTPGQTGYEPGNIHLIVNGGSFDNVYGGSRGTTAKGADVEGSILLEIHGGTVSNAIFGGSNVKGAIGGSITVNVEDGGNAECPLDVSTADVYGGGNQADYPGVPAPDSPITGTITHTSPYNYPEVNIKNATVNNVFGGGLNATVTGNPQIFIKKGSKVLGNVYGGGNMGEVNGNPRVIVNGKQTN